jgi:hypothetical protein
MTDGSTVTALVASLLVWIHANIRFEVPPGEPQVRFVAHGELERMACARPCPVLGFTPDGRPDRIFLDRELDVTRDVCERSILLHELVHYIQHRQDRYAELPPVQRDRMREGEALRIQDIYLRQHGRTLYVARGVAARGLAPPYC